MLNLVCLGAWSFRSAGARDVKNYGRAFTARRRFGTLLRDQPQAEEQGIRDGQDFAIRPMLGSNRLYTCGKGLFGSDVCSPIDFTLQTTQIFHVTAPGLPSPRLQIALNCILDLKKLGITRMNGQSFCNPCQGPE